MASTFPTGYVTWGGYSGVRTCYPSREDNVHTGPIFSTSIVSQAQWLEPLLTGTARLAPLPTQAMKSHYTIETCALEIVSTYNVTYARVTYVTVTSTVTEREADMLWQPIFPTTNGFESKASFTGSKYGINETNSTTGSPMVTRKSSNISLVTAASADFSCTAVPSPFPKFSIPPRLSNPVDEPAPASDSQRPPDLQARESHLGVPALMTPKSHQQTSTATRDHKPNEAAIHPVVPDDTFRHGPKIDWSASFSKLRVTSHTPGTPSANVSSEMSLLGEVTEVTSGIAHQKYFNSAARTLETMARPRNCRILS